MKVANQGVYERMEFPDYVFREYPKSVKTKDGRTVTVKDVREEVALSSELAPEQTVRDAVLQERDDLAAQVAALSAQVAVLLGAQAAQPDPVTKPKKLDASKLGVKSGDDPSLPLDAS